jgi:serine/threonine-protein kinase
MKPYSPLVTLGVGVALAAGVSVLDIRAASDRKTEPTPSVAVTSATTTTTAPPPQEDRQGSYAGYAKIKGASVALAVTVKGDKAIAYLCDGTALESWLRGSASPGGGLDLTGKAGAALAGTFGTDGALAGKVTVNKGTYSYALKRAVKPSGLYRATAATRKATIGWIVQEDGRQYGLATSTDGKSEPAPRLDAQTLTAMLYGDTITATPAEPAGD